MSSHLFEPTSAKSLRVDLWPRQRHKLDFRECAACAHVQINKHTFPSRSGSTAQSELPNTSILSNLKFALASPPSIIIVFTHRSLSAQLHVETLILNLQIVCELDCLVGFAVAGKLNKACALRPPVVKQQLGLQSPELSILEDIDHVLLSEVLWQVRNEDRVRLLVLHWLLLLVLGWASLGPKRVVGSVSWLVLIATAPETSSVSSAVASITPLLLEVRFIIVAPRLGLGLVGLVLLHLWLLIVVKATSGASHATTAPSVVVSSTIATTTTSVSRSAVVIVVVISP